MAIKYWQNFPVIDLLLTFLCNYTWKTELDVLTTLGRLGGVVIRASDL